MFLIDDAFCDGRARNCTGRDRDLFFPEFGNILIISEDNDFNDPDDSRDGGTIIASFDSLVTNITLTLLDIERPRGRNAQGNSVSAFLDGTQVALFDNLSSGNNESLRLSLGEVIADEIRISLSGSGAIGTITSTPVPVPAALPLFLSGLGLVAFRRRKAA